MNSSPTSRSSMAELVELLTESDSILLAVRHAESRKNIKDIHGGQGEGLTEIGRAQIAEMGDLVRSVFQNAVPLIICSPAEQVVETANSLAAKIAAAKPQVDPELRGIGLGVLSGLDSETASARHPEAFGRLKAWDQGRLGIDLLAIPGGEAVQDFVDRITKRLLASLGSCGRVVFVATRSTMILVDNIARMQRGFSLERYRPTRFPPGGYVQFGPFGLVKRGLRS